MYDLSLPDYLYTTFVSSPKPMSSSSEPLFQWFTERSPMTFLYKHLEACIPTMLRRKSQISKVEEYMVSAAVS